MKSRIIKALASYSKYSKYTKAIRVNDLFKALIALHTSDVINRKEYDELTLLLHKYIAEADIYYEICDVMSKESQRWCKNE